TVVLGCHEDDAVRCGDFGLEPFYLRRLVSIIILIVERQVADLDRAEREVRRCELRKRVRELAVEAVAAQAADDDSDLLAHRYLHLWFANSALVSALLEAHDIAPRIRSFDRVVMSSRSDRQQALGHRIERPGITGHEFERGEAGRSSRAFGRVPASPDV